VHLFKGFRKPDKRGGGVIAFFQRLYHFEELIRWGGHVVLVAIVFAETGLLAGFFLPGDSLLVTAGLLAAAKVINVWLLLGELSAAAILGDTLNYAIGRRLGEKLFTREDSFFFRKDHLVRTQRFYEKYGAKTIVLARFVPIVRTFAPAVAGVGQMRYRRFLFFNIAGGIAWVLAMVLTGYFLGRSIPNVDRHVHQIIFIVIFLSFIPIGLEYLKARKEKTHV
jgi:membrane-associated protein